MQLIHPLDAAPEVFRPLDFIRQGTHDLHERLERRLDITSHFSSLESYRQLLVRFYGFYATLEEDFQSSECEAAWIELDLRFKDRQKLTGLAHDLLFLGLQPSDLSLLNRYPNACPSRLISTPQLIGSTYVVEGATLGGQIIGVHLERMLGLKPGGQGAKFFSGYGARTGIMWRGFRNCVERHFSRSGNAGESGRPASIQSAVDSARAVFTNLESWLLDDDGPSEKVQP